MKYLTVVDGATVEKDTDEDRVDELLEQLRASVQATCKHPVSERHVRHSTTPDTNESYEVHYCESCQGEWTIFPEDAA